MAGENLRAHRHVQRRGPGASWKQKRARDGLGREVQKEKGARRHRVFVVGHANRRRRKPACLLKRSRWPLCGEEPGGGTAHPSESCSDPRGKLKERESVDG